MTNPEENIPEEGPPVFRTWQQLYLFVLVLHVLILSLFYLLTQYFS